MISEHRFLTDPALAAIAGLEQRVVTADGGRLKLEWGALRRRSGEEVDDLLWFEGDRLIGFLGLYAFGGPLELAGMVDPDARRRGIGTALVDRALDLAAGRGVERVLLVVARTTPAGAAFARSLGGVLEHSEHSLVLRDAPVGPPGLDGVSVRAARPDEDGAVASMLAAGFGEELVGPISHDPSERPLLVELAGTVVGTLRVDVDKAAGAAIGKGAGAAIGKGAGAATAGIYGFAVDPTRRGQGIGREVLRQVCTGLFDEGCSEVHLEVEVVNERALGLYTSIGFEQRATEDYYALDTQNRTPS